MSVRAVLLDIEGVLYVEGSVIPGAAEAVAELRRHYAIRFLTNVTTTPRAALCERLRGLGIAVAPEEIFTPAVAARDLLRARGIRRVHLAAAPGLRADLGDLEFTDSAPEAVVLGDLYRGFTWERLNGLFRMLMGGAVLVALHRNRYCRREGEIALDLGPFVAALEYAANTSAIVVGKPSREFFARAVAALDTGPEETVMVGDDLEADVGGAQAAGLRAVQVETGKFRESDRSHPSIRPDARVPSIASLPARLAQW